MTASAVSAIDFGQNAFPQLVTENLADLLWRATGPVGEGNPGYCWVSHKCYEPQIVMEQWILPVLSSFSNLKVFLNTVVIATNTSASGVPAGQAVITSITAVQRTPVDGTDGWARLLSEQVEDWYSPVDSQYFGKQVITFQGGASSLVVVEATEFGDVLMTSNLSVAQGIEADAENSTTYVDYCGQGTTIDFYMSFGEDPGPSPDPWPAGSDEGEPFSLGNNSWAWIWSYRRVRGFNSSDPDQTVQQGEISLQNWGGGNDYDMGYLFMPVSQARQQVADGQWRGGLNVTALAQAEQRAYGWYHQYKNWFPNATMQQYLTLNTTQTNTSTGLAKMPYLRDARRGTGGIDGFRLLYEPMLNTSNRPQYPDFGVYFNDTIGIGNYNSDIHTMLRADCPTPSYLHIGITKKYYLPFRALTHAESPNLLLAGKSMSMSFWANAATRLHPEEWMTGTAAGVAAGLMVENGWSTSDVYANILALKQRLNVSAGQPLTWSHEDVDDSSGMSVAVAPPAAVEASEVTTAASSNSEAAIATSRRALLWLVPYGNITSIDAYAQMWSQIGQHAAKYKSAAVRPVHHRQQHHASQPSSIEYSVPQAAQQVVTPTGYIVAGSAYALKQDGSLGYANTTAGEGLYGQYMEQYGFPALQQLNLSNILAMIYFTHYAGISIVLANPQPFVDAVVQKVLAFNLSGVDLDYEPQGVAAAVESMRGADQQATAAVLGAGDPFSSFLSLLASSLSSQGCYLTVDIGGGCGGGTNNCGAWVPIAQQGLVQVNTEDTFGINSVNQFDGFANNDQSPRNGGLGQPLWAPGFEPGNLAGNPSLFGSILQYAATGYAAADGTGARARALVSTERSSASAGDWNVTQIATWAVHEWNTGPQPEWYFSAIDAFLEA